jgi:hypothetical protein
MLRHHLFLFHVGEARRSGAGRAADKLTVHDRALKNPMSETSVHVASRTTKGQYEMSADARHERPAPTVLSAKKRRLCADIHRKVLQKYAIRIRATPTVPIQLSTVIVVVSFVLK